MSQTDMNVANAPGAAVRADINAHLDAIATNNSGAVAPTITFANMWWYDTSTSTINQRNNANTVWLTLWKRSGSGWQVLLTKGVDIASATVLVPGSDGNYFDVTGTTTVTSIASISIGTVIKLHFDGILTLTHQATNLVLPGGSNITTAAGDEVEFTEYASGDWRCTGYLKEDGTALAFKLSDDTAPKLGGFLDPNSNYVGLDKGADIASASSLVIGTDGDYFDITGTTGVSSMTVAANRFFLLQFDAGLVITDSASIVIPGGVNFTTSSGDQLLCFSTAINTVRVVSITKADGSSSSVELSGDLSPQLGGFLDPNGNYIGSEKGGNLSSASTLVIDTDGDYFDVTGTTGINNIAVAANRRFRLRFNGSVLIAVSGSLILNNNGGNFTTTVGDVIDFQSTSLNAVVGTIVKVDGTSPIASGGAWNLIGTIEASADSTITITGIDDTYDFYALVFNKIRPSNNSATLELGLGNSGGINTSTNYDIHTASASAASTSYDADVAVNSTFFAVSNTVGNSVGRGVSGVLFLQRRVAATQLRSAVLSGTLSTITSSETCLGGQVTGIHTASLDLDRVQLEFSAGTITDGRFSVYGVSHA